MQFSPDFRTSVNTPQHINIKQWRKSALYLAWIELRRCFAPPNDKAIRKIDFSESNFRRPRGRECNRAKDFSLQNERCADNDKKKETKETSHGNEETQRLAIAVNYKTISR